MSEFTIEPSAGDTQETQISPEDMKLIVLPDEELAKLELDRQVMSAENDPNMPSGDMALLRLQRRLVGMTESDADLAGLQFGKSTGRFVTIPRGVMGNSRLPVLWRQLRRDLVVSDAAASARWNILGVDDPIAEYGRATSIIESGWRDAARANTDAAKARERAELLASYASQLPPHR